MDIKISKHTNDIIQKYANSVFRDVSLAFYGLNIPKIKELINVELPVVEVKESRTDILFLLEDNSYLHLEFQSVYNKGDLIRFAHYDLRLYERDKRPVTTVVIYPAGVKSADTDLKIGTLKYCPDKIMMGGYDGNTIFTELEVKIRDGKPLDDVDMMNLIFLPLMNNDLPKEELAVKSIKLAQTIEDAVKRNACIAAVFAFGNKYLDETQLKGLKEVLRMTDLAVMFKQEGRQEGRQEERLEIAREMLKEGSDVEFVARITKLNIERVRELQSEPDHD